MVSDLHGTTIYILGPMSGYPDLNQVKFRDVAKLVRAVGCIPIVPHDIEPYPHNGAPCPAAYDERTRVYAPGEHSAACYLRSCLRTLLSADSVLLLDNWHTSVGATIEHDSAVKCGMPTVSESFFRWYASTITRS